MPYYVLLFALMSTISAENTFFPATDTSIVYSGRVDRSRADRVMFDWPGITIQTVFEGPSCEAVFEGMDCFDAFVDGVLTSTFRITPKKKTSVVVAKGLTDRPHRLLIVKRSESNAGPVSFYGLTLEKGKRLSPPPAPAYDRKIEFIGDSYTAGFANEYLNLECPPGREDSVILSATNAYKAFGPLVARAFGAHYHIIAISGKGLLRNYNGIDKGKEILKYYDRALLSSVNSGDKSSIWDFSKWKADVVVISIGINDFQADPPYPDSAAFDAAYAAFIERLRRQYPGVKIICCATRVWPTDGLIPRIKAVVEKEQAAGKTDVFYFEFSTGNGALYGHPSVYDHVTIAEGLIPVVAKATGWRRTDMMRGK